MRDSAQRTRQLTLDIFQPAPPSLENFVAGRNRELLHTLTQLTTGNGESTVFLWGTPGSGRSHLLNAVALLDARVLTIDDAEKLNETRQAGLFNLWLAEPRPRVLVAAAYPPAQLDLRRDLVTRLAAGLVYQVHALTDDEKSEALRRRAEERGFALNREVADYLLNHTRRDVRSLFAVLDAADALALAEKREVTVPLIKQVLQRALPLEKRD